MNHKLRVFVRMDVDPAHVTLEITGCVAPSDSVALMHIVRRAGRIGAGAEVMVDLHGTSHLDPDVLLDLRRLADASPLPFPESPHAGDPGAAVPFRLTLDEPQALGGSDAGPNPIELVLAALGACQEITYRLYADTLGIPLDRVSVSVSGRLDLRGFFAVDEGVRPGFKDVTATVRIDSPAPADEIERLRATVDRHCPVLDILRSVTPVKTRIELSAAAQKPAA